MIYFYILDKMTKICQCVSWYYWSLHFCCKKHLYIILHSFFSLLTQQTLDSITCFYMPYIVWKFMFMWCCLEMEGIKVRKSMLIYDASTVHCGWMYIIAIIGKCTMESNNTFICLFLWSKVATSCPNNYIHSSLHLAYYMLICLEFDS